MMHLSSVLFVATCFGLADVVQAQDQKIPLIFDNDANYDDTLALMYLAANPLFDLKAVTVAGAGFATHQGGPPNMQMVLELMEMGVIPTSYGPPTSLSPISTFPLQWRIGVDQFFQAQNMSLPMTPLSAYPSDVLIAKVLKESPTAVAVAVTGPATNLALALQKEPELIERISALFLMGSNYGGGPNNVYDWQMEFAGVTGSCSEDPTANSFTPYEGSIFSGNGTVAMRPGCRGNSMSESGDTEWNVFLDAVGWNTVTRIAADATTSPPVYVITSGATEEMPITMEDFEEGTQLLEDDAVANFTMSLAQAFLGAGEAKWWDAQLVIAMYDIIIGLPIEESVCAEWLETSGFKVNLNWQTVTETGALNPYGSITDVEDMGPQGFFCRHGNVANMQAHYWEMLASEAELGSIVDPDLYLRELSTSDGGGSGAASFMTSGSVLGWSIAATATMAVASVTGF